MTVSGPLRLRRSPARCPAPAAFPGTVCRSGPFIATRQQQWRQAVSSNAASRAVTEKIVRNLISRRFLSFVKLMPAPQKRPHIFFNLSVPPAPSKPKGRPQAGNGYIVVTYRPRAA